MSELVVVDGNREFRPETYNRMCAAIAACATIDDCNDAQSRAAAMAVYYRQINDQEAWQKLNEIRMRAWRRMAEIVATVDTSKCDTQRAMARKVRETLGEDATSMISDSRIIQLIKLAGIPAHGFEAALAETTGSIDEMIRRAHPDKIKEREQAAKHAKDYEKIAENRRQQESAEADAAMKRQRAEAEKRADDLIEMVKDKAIMEAPEVGLTLSAKASAKLVKFDVMMDRKMHDQLRDAAHERRTTMWAILREAANYWFVVNGYEKV